MLPHITLAGRARTALSVDVYEIVENCYEKEIASGRIAVDRFKGAWRPWSSHGRLRARRAADYRHGRNHRDAATRVISSAS
jgi:hypothetical protein